MYMQEALELVCRKRKLANPNDYVLLVADKSLVIALDRTVASLAGTRELVLMKKSALAELGGVMEPGRTTDPNGAPNSVISLRLLNPFDCLSFHFQAPFRRTRDAVPCHLRV